MVTSCAVPLCTNRQRKGSNVKFYRLPLKNKKLLKAWLTRIRCESIPVNNSTRICSDHFEGKRKKGKNDVPSVFAWTKRAKARSTRTSIGQGENPACLDNSTSSSTTDARFSGAENLFLLAEVAESESTDNSRMTCDEDFSSLDILADLCTHLVPTCNKECQVNFYEEQLREKENVIQELKLSLETSLEQEVNAVNVKKDKAKLNFHTGFNDSEIFDCCFAFVTKGQLTLHTQAALSLEDQFLLVLIRLRLGLSEQLLSYIFKINISSVSRIFLRWIPAMYRRFKLINIWPSKDKVINTMPMSVAVKYPQLRVIIDCTEVKIPKPKGPVNQQTTFSSYKNCNTAKALIGISPTGAISFISDLYGGSISDKEITKKSGLLDMMDAGDVIMADRGFLIEDLARPYNISVNVPPFTGGKEQFTPHEVALGRRIANTRIHVERAIGQIKEYKLLSHILVPQLIPYLNEIFFVCALLTNFKKQLISK